MQALLHDRMVRVLFAAAAVCLLMCVYTRAYDGFTQKGYQRANLMNNLVQIRKENERLRLELEMLRQPTRIENFARSNGMKPSEEMAFVRPAGQPRLAQNVAE
jgi:cell division protein FtsL